MQNGEAMASGVHWLTPRMVYVRIFNLFALSVWMKFMVLAVLSRFTIPCGSEVPNRWTTYLHSCMLLIPIWALGSADLWLPNTTAYMVALRQSD